MLFDEVVHVGIIGARARNSLTDFQKVSDVFDQLRGTLPNSKMIIVSGGCPLGGDRFAELIAEREGIIPIIFFPKIDRTANVSKQEFRDAAYARNTLIANASDYLIACVVKDAWGGTGDTIKKFLNTHSPERLILV